MRAKRLMHGKTDLIHHDDQGLFAGLDNPFQATRYHSLVIEPDTLTDRLRRHRLDRRPGRRARSWASATSGYPLYGVQFHPESFLTHSGYDILRTFLKDCKLTIVRCRCTLAGARDRRVDLSSDIRNPWPPKLQSLPCSPSLKLTTIARRVRPQPPQRLRLSELLGLRLAEDMVSRVDSPPFDKSQVDGYAIATGDASETLREFGTGDRRRRAESGGAAGHDDSRDDRRPDAGGRRCGGEVGRLRRAPTARFAIRRRG